MTITQTSLDFVADHRDADVRRLALATKRSEDLDLAWALDQIAGRQRAVTKLPGWAACDGVIYPPHIALEQCSSQWTAAYKGRLARRLIARGAGTSSSDNGPDEPRSGTLLVDLTGGLGVDCRAMAEEFDHAVYVERQEKLCDIAAHNFAMFGLPRIEVVHAEATAYLAAMDPATLIYLDPSRRDDHGARTYAIADCTPNLLAMLPGILEKAPYCMVKLSPMLDWRKTVDDCGGRVSEVHIVSTGNVCRELLLVLERGHSEGMPIHVVCINDDERCDIEVSGVTLQEITAGEQSACESACEQPDCEQSAGEQRAGKRPAGERSAGGQQAEQRPAHTGRAKGLNGLHDVNGLRDAGGLRDTAGFRTIDGLQRIDDVQNIDGLQGMDRLQGAESPQGVAHHELTSYRFLYEPNVSVMKAGYFAHVARRFAMRQLGRDSHLFVSAQWCPRFPGRGFAIVATTPLSKREVKSALGDLHQANVAVRNFPLSVAALRRRLKLRDGGETYLFATTTADDMHIVIRCVKAVPAVGA